MTNGIVSNFKDLSVLSSLIRERLKVLRTKIEFIVIAHEMNRDGSKMPGSASDVSALEFETVITVSGRTQARMIFNEKDLLLIVASIDTAIQKGTDADMHISYMFSGPDPK